MDGRLLYNHSLQSENRKKYVVKLYLPSHSIYPLTLPYHPIYPITQSVVSSMLIYQSSYTPSIDINFYLEHYNINY